MKRHSKAQEHSKGAERHEGAPPETALHEKYTASEFLVFQEQIDRLDAELRTLSNEARQLGSSVGILSASSRLRERLANILLLFHRNAAELFSELAKPTQPGVELQRHGRKTSQNSKAQQAHKEVLKSDPENISQELHMFSRDISTLLECFSQFPEFVDEIPDRSLGDDLKYWATSLDELKDDFGTHAVQRFLYDSMADIGERLDHLAADFIPIFIKIGIPTVRSSQKHSASVLENLATIATLFSGVTATMLQFSWSPPEATTLFAAVNVFWFTSLVFSISAAVNSLLGLTWTQAFFRSPDHRVPWWVRMWITRSPLAFLVLSVACFFVGLVVFVYASHQATITSTVTTVLSTSSCFGLAAMSFWFACEFWIYNRHGGRLWLGDVLWDQWQDFLRHPLVRKGLHQPREIWDQGKRMGRRVLTQAAADDPEALPLPNNPIGHHRRQHTLIHEIKESPTVSFWLSVDKGSMKPEEISRHRWHEAVRRILDSKHVEHIPAFGKPVLGGYRFAHLRYVVPSVRSSDVIHKFQQMRITQQVLEHDVHEGLVKFLQFSPDGKLLVTSSWDGKSFVFEVTNNLLRQRTIAHPIDRGFVKHIEWSSEGDMVLMRSNRAITVYRKDDGIIVGKRTQEDDHTIRSVAWLRNGKGVISIEGNRVVQLELPAIGEELRSHRRDCRIEKFKIRDIAVNKDSRWMLCIGKSESTDDDKATALNKTKHEIVVYSLADYAVVKRHRVYNEMCSVSLTFNDTYALVSHENKAPPQLWKFRGTWGKDALLSLEHTYLPRKPAHFAALPSTFGGHHDQFVLRATTAGDIYFWDTYTARMLYRLQAPSGLGHLTAFAWNRNSEMWMLATGTHEGTVHIWSIPTPERPALDILSAGLGESSPFDASESILSSTPPPKRSHTSSTFGFGGRAMDSPTSQAHALPLVHESRQHTLVESLESAGTFVRHRLGRVHRSTTG